MSTRHRPRGRVSEVKFERLLSGSGEFYIARPDGGADLARTLELKPRAEAYAGKELQLLKPEGLIASAIEDRALLERLFGWCYVDGSGMSMLGIHTLGNDEKLTVAFDSEIDKTIYLYPGNGQLSLYAYTDREVEFFGWRFLISAAGSKKDAAPIVAFGPKQRQGRPGRETLFFDLRIRDAETSRVDYATEIHAIRK